MTVEYKDGMVFLDNPVPRFGWELEGKKRGLLQTAWQIVVQETEFGKIVWNSGKKLSDQNVHIKYDGEKLQPETTYQWQLTVWNQENECSSKIGLFETALVSGDDSCFGNAKWIGSNELPLYADYLAVYKVKARLQIKEGSERAGFMIGGDDSRLMDRNKNLYGLENKAGESFVSFILDISGLVKKQAENSSAAEAGASILVYRVGYAPDDSKNTPFARIPVPNSLLNSENCYLPHDICVECIYGECDIFLDGHDWEHQLVRPESEDAPFWAPYRLNLNPLGRGGDYICFPTVNKIGISLEEGQEADFKSIEIRNYRKPSNVLYAGVPDQPNKLIPISHGGNCMLRHEFTVDKKVKRARIYATARGIYELYLNGSRVGNAYFAPGLSQYNKSHYYQAYDVTDFLREGKNAIGGILAEGWWSGAISYTGTNWNFWGDRTSLILKCVITYEDDSTRTVVTNPGNWKYSDQGPIKFAGFFQGEVRDTRLDGVLENFSICGYDDSKWKWAEEIVPNDKNCFVDAKEMEWNPVFRLQPDDGVTVVQNLTAVSVTSPRSNVWIYDMGQNIAGIPEITVEGTAGQELVLRYAEVLYPDLDAYKENAGMIMMENIRGAMAADRFILKGGVQTISPAFTYHGYRYVEVTGIERPLPCEAVKGLCLSSAHRMEAEFECSDARINRLYKNIEWSLRDNFVSVPTDCPQRNERMGWSGDLSVFSRTAVAMTMNEPFLKRHMQAMRDTQSLQGRFADIAPVGGGFGGVLWGSAGITVPWEMYMQYGDLQILQEHYDAMSDYMDFLGQTRDENGIVKDGPLGDWLGPEYSRNTPEYLWQVYYLYDLSIMEKTAALLKKTKDCEKWTKLFEQGRAAWKRLYLDSDTGKTQNMDTQTSYAVPLALEVTDSEITEKMAEHLDVCCKRETLDDEGNLHPAYSLMTGFIGTAWISQALSNAGYHETAWRMLKQEDYPSWLYPVKQGATTIWERLNSYTVERGFGGNNSMNSFNHYSFGAVGAWILGYAGGIRRSNAGMFEVCPVPDPDGDVTWAKVQLHTVQGTFKVSWNRKENGFCYYIHIPGGKRTVVSILNPSGKEIFINGTILKNTVEISDVMEKKACVQFMAVPGDYEIRTVC